MVVSNGRGVLNFRKSDLVDVSTHGSRKSDIVDVSTHGSIHSIREAYDESAIKKNRMSRNHQFKRVHCGKHHEDVKEELHYGEHLEDEMHDVALARLCEEQILAMRLYETRIASLQRCVAFFVLFHQMGKRVADFWPQVSFGYRAQAP